jgi:DNA-directed RNA polymerase subunit RPC12/RpoP
MKKTWDSVGRYLNKYVCETCGYEWHTDTDSPGEVSRCWSCRKWAFKPVEITDLEEEDD